MSKVSSNRSRTSSFPSSGTSARRESANSQATTIDQHPIIDESRPRILGIWRLGDVIQTSSTIELSLAQPADAAGSPRWDYVLKRALGSESDIQPRRQISQFVGAAAEVTHPNLVPILDASATASSPYLVMPKLEGKTMQSLMTSSDVVPLPVALWFVRQTAQAISALHKTGWIHGDVKPDNVMVGPRGHVTLIDLGFASRIHTVSSHRYRGTPEYSAPEAMTGEMAAMTAMDIFSMGRMLWKWLTRTEHFNQALLEPVAELVEAMVCEDPQQRPVAKDVENQLLRLEIETLGSHIGPGQQRAA